MRNTRNLLSEKVYSPTLDAALVVLATVLIVTLVYAPNAWAGAKFKTLYKFKGGKDGDSPDAGLIFDQAGNLYGTTQSGGADGAGTVFQLTPNQNGGWTESVLYSFCSLANCADGGYPTAGLIFDRAGNLYGTTTDGGAHGAQTDNGTVFQLTPNQNGGWTEHVLYSFCSRTNCADGKDPTAGLTFDQAGNLYGTTYGGGAHTDNGTVFQLTPNQNGGWTEHVLHSFCSRTNCADGWYPSAGLIFDQAGNLYGTTLAGGAQTYGTVFQLTPNQNGGWTEHVLYSFCSRTNCADGTLPYAGLIFDQVGNLYGTTYTGPSGGTVFQLTPNQSGGWTEHVLHSFCSRTNCADGEFPFAGLILDRAGNLYGTTVAGGTQNFGTVFQLTPNQNGGWTEHVLHAFLDKPGAQPFAGLILDEAGNLYGTSAGDFEMTFGSVFEITP
jgi:uncharacterized repeat protein (TIGR03803 family)